MRFRLPLLAALLLAFPAFALGQDADADSTAEKLATKELPLEPGRTLTFTVDEGTWMSVDVHPDGQTVVFDLLGDLYTVPINGGAATRLTEGMPFDAQPRYSPDGQHLVFTSDRSGGQNIWTMDLATEEFNQVSKGMGNRAESPEWMPDGDYLLASMGDFRGSNQPRLHLYHIDGGSGTKLIDGENLPKMLGAAFGDDGRWVWFASRTGPRDWEYNAQLPQYVIRAYDRETGQTYTRVARQGGAFRPTLSPDGRWLAYGTRHDQQTGLILRDLASGEERWLAYPVQHDDQESRATLDVLPGMSFTPDSRHLVASYGGKLWKIDVAANTAAEIPFSVDVEQPVGPDVFFDYPIEDTPTFVVRQIRDASPSPDGTRLAFTALDRLYLADADGANPREVTGAGENVAFPAWSPDGRWLSYVTWDGQEGHVWKVAASGGEAQRLTEAGGMYLAPVWNPDGSRVVFVRGQARNFRESGSPFAAFGSQDELAWVPASGGDLNLIAPLEGRGDAHFVMNRPERIYLYHGSKGLLSIRWDGTDEKAHLKVTGPRIPGSSNPLSPSTVRMAPRGDQALAEINRQLYVVTVPQTGSTPTVSVSSPAFPVKDLTDATGAEFPAWSWDARQVHWSLGNAHFVYDLDAAEVFADSLKAAEKAKADAEEDEGDEEEAEGEEDAEDEEKKDEEKKYKPIEFRITIDAPRDTPSGTAVLRGGRAVTLRGDEVIENADIVVRDNRIVAVGAQGTVDVPAGAEIIDVSGHTIVPGFVDTHAHMWPSWGLHRTDQWIYAANLAYGVTTTRDPQTATTDVLTYADRVRSGDIPGPRVYSTGPGVFWQENLKSLDQAREVMRRYADYFDTKTIKMYVAGNRQQRQWIIQAARELKLMPTTEGSLNIKQNIAETIDNYPGLEHSLPIYPVYDDVIQLFAQTRRVYTPTLLVSYGGPWAENYFFQTENVHGDTKLRRFYPHDELDGMTLRRPQWFSAEEHVFDKHARFVADLVEAGGLAGVGSHGQLQGLGYHWELWAVASGGLSNHDALRVASLHGAEAIGLHKDLGSIEPGKLADLVILRQNPLDDLRNTNTIRFVMKNGRLYNGDTLAEVYPRQTDGPSYWWQTLEPTGLPGVSSDLR